MIKKAFLNMKRQAASQSPKKTSNANEKGLENQKDSKATENVCKRKRVEDNDVDSEGKAEEFAAHKAKAPALKKYNSCAVFEGTKLQGNFQGGLKKNKSTTSLFSKFDKAESKAKENCDANKGKREGRYKSLEFFVQRTVDKKLDCDNKPEASDRGEGSSTSLLKEISSVKEVSLGPVVKAFTVIKEEEVSLGPAVNAFTVIKEEKAASASSEISPSHLSPIESPPLISSYRRHVVASVSKEAKELRVRLLAESGAESECSLRGSWAFTALAAGDVVHLLEAECADPAASAPDSYVVDDQRGFCVVNPDLLVSGTSVVSSLFCMRKAVLNEKFKGLEGGSKTMFVGTLVHELLQECLSASARTLDDIKTQLEVILKRNATLHDLLTLNMNLSEMRREVEPFLPHILYFIQKYLLGQSVPAPVAAFQSGESSQRGRPPPPPSPWSGSIVKVADIEENIWSPRLGVKGKVDITVEVRMHSKDKRGRSRKTLPLELKTGRASSSAEHRGQLILYSMMMSERRDDPEAGLLLYLRNSTLLEVAAGRNEMRGLVQLRNELTGHLLADKQNQDDKSLSSLPEPLNLPRACGQCPHLTACALHQRLTASVPAAPHAMADLVPKATDHLHHQDLEFFARWMLATAMEDRESASHGTLKDLWCKNAAQRELQGMGIASLALDSVKETRGMYRHTFRRASEKPLPCVFTPGDSIMVSSETELALAQGVAVLADRACVVVTLDKDLGSSQKDKRYHLDRLEYQGGSSSGLVNLVRLMSPEEERLRRLVVHRQAVSFLPGLKKDIIAVAKPILRPLNRSQQKAIFKTLMAEDYVLIKGMPGTGKTTMITALVRLLSAMGKSVLLTSYTNSAVDTVLLKLAEFEDTRFVRLGRTDRVHAGLQSYTAEAVVSAQAAVDVDKLRALYSGFPVVATTCLGIKHPAVAQRRFDYCILDEASQCQLLSALGPLFSADKFVLVGDPKQLPPVVKSQKAREAGLDTSLFSYLETDSNTIALTVQYRMNSTIMACANHLVYDGQLSCGSDEVAERTLLASHAKSLMANWLEKCLSAQLEEAIVFVDTSEADAFETTSKKGVTNLKEADLAAKILTTLHCHFGLGGSKPTIGVIAPYRAQVDLLRGHLRGFSDVDVSTVDQFQGKDKDVIVYVCTRSRPASSLAPEEPKSGEILNDLRRLNVALTRAKSKLIVIGNRSTLQKYDTFRSLFAFLKPIQCSLLKSDDIL